MSYLSSPRLHFSGLFQADPSTVNNDPAHFDPRAFRPNYQLPGVPNATGMTNGWWNPRGSGAWRFRDCVVRKVVYLDGSEGDDPALDAVLGSPINDELARVEGKIVDLDPEQQGVSEIWGLRVTVGRPSSGCGFAGNFLSAPFADIWPRYPKGQPDSMFGAYYQSVVEAVDWAGAGGSRWLQELCLEGQPPTALSLRFNVDGFNDDSTSPLFTFGRVTGVLGPWTKGEPRRFLAGRILNPAPGSPLNTAYAEVVGHRLHLDLGNSLPTVSVGGALVDLGRLYLAYLDPDGSPRLLGEIRYQDSEWYSRSTGIVTVVLGEVDLAAIAARPLAVVQPANLSGSLLLAEPADGLWLRADQTVFRLNPGDRATTVFHATRFGRPASGVGFSLGLDPSNLRGQIQQGPVPGPRKVGEPADALRFASSLTTGTDGTVQLELTAGDPGNPREYIDGQLYGISYQEGTTPPSIGSVGNQSLMLNALVWSGYEVPERPTWMRHIRPILQQYANLYPVMRPMVDLGDYASLLQRRAVLRNVFQAPESDPNYMPVTRDLSQAKRETLLRWLGHPRYMSLESVEDLRLALQTAVELEHATIPVYLTALYSLKDGCNTEIAGLIRSVVVEEMLHMAIAANLLLAVGGQPRMNDPSFVPRYPGPLPGGLRSGLTVRLRRCSLEQIRDVFMAIEQPEELLEPVRGRVDQDDPLLKTRCTIGWFYDEILRALEQLVGSGRLSLGNADRQVSEWSGPGKLYVIRTLDDARAAMAEIKDQGEGRGPLHPGDGDHELAHYYKFAQIVEGRRLVVDKGSFGYTGEVIPFDSRGVWPMVDDPDLETFPVGSRARVLALTFAQSYQALLNGLHRAFEGKSTGLSEAIGMMYSLSVTARELVQTPSGLGDGSTAGPVFGWPGGTGGGA